MSKHPTGDLVDLEAVRLGKLEPCTRFVLEVRDAGSGPGQGVFDWRWRTEDLDGDQWHPNTRHIGRQLRRIADRYDPRPCRPLGSRKRHRVRSVG